MRKFFSLICVIIVTQMIFINTCFAETYLKIGLKYGKSSTLECSVSSDSGFYGMVNGEHQFIADEGKLIIKYENGSINIYSATKDLCYFQITDPAISLEIAPASGEKITFNNSPYRGSIIIAKDTAGIKVINCVELESYLKSVVPSEMPSSWHIEALKAQAICARNYALSNIGKYKSYGFDMDDTTANQVYKGINSENPNTNRAVTETAGIYLKYDDELVQTFFFSSGAGSTENVKDVWGSNVPYLKSVEVPNEEVREWEKTYTRDDLNERLTQMGINIGAVLKIDITKRSETGRVTEVVIKGETGTYTAKLEKARTVFGLNSAFYDITGSMNILPLPDLTNMPAYTQGAVLGNYISDLLDPKNVSENSDFIFRGKGSGHAVGLSQYGAKALAEQGYTFDQILTHFYTGSYIVTN